MLGLAADDPVAPEMGFFDLGMDSLTSVELRRRLERGSRTFTAFVADLQLSQPSVDVRLSGARTGRSGGAKEQPGVRLRHRQSRKPCSTI